MYPRRQTNCGLDGGVGLFVFQMAPRLTLCCRVLFLGLSIRLICSLNFLVKHACTTAVFTVADPVLLKRLTQRYFLVLQWVNDQ